MLETDLDAKNFTCRCFPSLNGASVAIILRDPPPDIFGSVMAHCASHLSEIVCTINLPYPRVLLSPHTFCIHAGGKYGPGAQVYVDEFLSDVLIELFP